MTAVLGAFTYLTVTSARNRFLRQVRRLRSPRYVLALLLALGYFWLILINPARSGSAPGHVLVGEGAELAAALALVALATYWWIVGSDQSALAFAPAEVQFLFPAPVTRRQLVQFKLVRAQVLILFNILIWSLLLRRGAGEGVLTWLRPISLWVLFSTFQLHRLGATLARASVAEHGEAGVRRSGLAVAVMAVILGAIAWGLVRAWPATGVASLQEALQLVERAAEQPAAAWALLPFRAVVAPAFAPDVETWLGAIGVAAAIMLAHFVWVVRADTAFEDAALEASAERAARVAAWRGGGRMARRNRAAAGMASRWRLPLAAGGEPAVAILWKNTYAVLRGDRFGRQLFFFAAIVVAICAFAYLEPARTSGFLMGILAAWGSMLVLLGPLWLRNDLRGDLSRLELLRTYPVPASRLVAAEMASSALVLTVLELALGLCVFVALLRSPDVTLPLPDRLAVLTAGALALPAINLLSAGLHNGAALLFPGWLALGGGRRPGIEAMGQTYLTMIVSLLLLAVLLLFPVLVAAITGFALRGTYGIWSLPPAAVAGSAVAAGELALILRWLGRQFERTEPADVETAA
ncbi:MAG TPA: putative ABC exporter domain-containing protein [Gemmatimonadaceae bacterium]|nr:putative ABC exporter domain-containing protein [Gemmatimonadaceae bacterium]